MIRKLSDFGEIKELMVRIKNLGKGFVTNYYPDEVVTKIWIEKGLIDLADYGDVCFFLRRDDGFCHLSYYAVSMAAVAVHINSLPTETYVVDIVSSVDNAPEIAILGELGFKKHSALYRMSRVVPLAVTQCEAQPNVRPAKTSDIPSIKGFFHNHFDKYTEQIPSEEDLKKWIDVGSLLVYDDGCDELGGYIIHEHIGMTWYLRYWFTNPTFRNRGVGSTLLKEAIRRCEGVRRQILWVIESNENAIIRYEHYGFKKERMIDTIMINN